ncbi:Resolvase/invertase-type recombinase catalytic domain-containing protein [Streptomyces murinus]|uniref:recombinase family protein n=1 Tax=Streptomyces murinus TaxID=33900 RepID=UPI003D66E776
MGTNKAGDTRPVVDLLLRKSQIVREGERALSLRAQEDRGRRWADEEGYQVGKIWRENLSAWSDVERPKYDAALAELGEEDGPAALWVYALDRFSRKGAESVVPILGRKRVIFDYERLDTLNERDRQWIIQRAEDARAYSQRLSYNVRTTKARQRREGRWSGSAPYGTVAHPKTRKLRPQHEVPNGGKVAPWAVIVRIFSEAAAGVPLRAVARSLNADGIPGPGGKTWNANTVSRIVSSPVYEGWLVINHKVGAVRKPVPYLDEAGQRVRVFEKAGEEGVTEDAETIPAELAERARRIAKGHQPVGGNKTPKGRAYRPLSGRLKCGGCNRSMVASGRSYECTAYNRGDHCPAPASVLRTTLERFVSGRWLARMENSDPDDALMLVVAERWAALTRPKESQEAKDARAALKTAEDALGDLMAARYERREFEGAARKLFPRMLAHAEARLETAREEAQKHQLGPVDITFLLEGHAAAAWENAPDAMRRDLLGLAIDHVTVFKASGIGARFDGDKRTAIHWADVDQDEEAAA